MNQASLYERANQVQRHDAKIILEEYATILQWRSDGQDSLLDVGSGPGNVLMDFVHPLLPKGYQQLVGTDVSNKMVGYANKCYESYARTQFQVLDIGCDRLPDHLKGRFDHVTSFYCLHWVQNLRAALGNIYSLLRNEGGDCLLVFLASNPVFEVYKVLHANKKWAHYMQDVDQFISPLHYSTNPVEQFTQLLSEAGFIHHNVELRSEVFVYEGVNTLKDNVKAICPFLERIPSKQHEEFLDDFVDVVIAMNLQQDLVQDHNNDRLQQRFISPYKLIVAYARKSPDFLRNMLSEMGIKKSSKGLE
ncbi:juvenile hormone acid O-methyltransferase [Drosophila grimshawi]|uniref:Juvenile hormone acid O-methyltransferase n=1 Tax=Drosophila grimshawi TaxID=7222 RepID=B4JZ63_DROGR|nr:juvenile hormone acid O-methyltransferase [Drosophila grimshawi]EDV94172.1 GH25188 [Drosophila grimshawi]